MSVRTLNEAKSSTTIARNLSKERSFPNKRLIVCCDGTCKADDVHGQPLTNVAKFARCISDKDTWKDNKFIQIVHYQPGLGTGTGRMTNKWDALFGKGISRAIRAAYSFICLNWTSEHDEIVLIGFSRGAFTVRCVAQFIQEVGLLTKGGLRHLPNLFKAWIHLNLSENTKPSEKLNHKLTELKGWEELVKENIEIKVCAVWDTVKAVRKSHFPTVGKTIPPNIKFAIQALALGEKRTAYEPMKWNPPGDGTNQKLSQCWFAGNHSDVGGGNEDMTLANITLAWMIGQLTSKIQFNQDTLWAITTTREWSKPSPVSTLEDENHPGLRNCKVVATAPISSDLLRSTNSWRTLVMRIAGWELRDPGMDSVHYSVHILRHLGIAMYTKVAVLDTSSLSTVIPRDNENKFEEELLRRWAKHILCAHVNLKQARNMAETISSENPVYQRRLEGMLLSDASYEADIPVCAILSTFGKLKQDNESARLDTLFVDLQTQSQKPNARKQLPLFSQKPKASFSFERLEPVTTGRGHSSEASLVMNITTHQWQPTLVLTWNIPLLMGRAHELPQLETHSKLKRNLKKATKALKKKSDEIPPCQKCASIWERET